MANRISRYSKSKVVIHSTPIEGIQYLNIGKEVANYISTKIDDKWLSLKTKEHINTLLDEQELEHPKYGKIKAITNIGILLEPSLKIDLIKLLNDHSTKTPLYVECQAQIIDDKLFFLSEQNGKELNIKDLNYTLL